MSILNALPGAIAQGLIWGIMAIGVFLTYKVLDFADLSVDSSICTGAAVCAVLMTNGVNVYLALLAAFASGLLAGLLTGLLHTVLGISPILSGILTQLTLWSLNLKIMGQANLPLSSRQFHVLVSQLSIGPTILILFGIIAVLIGLLYWFFGTELGSSIRATGSNEQMSKAQGINTNRTKIITLMLSNGIVALSGALLAQYQGFADINMGRGAIVIGLAAVIIGGAIFRRIGKNFALKLFSVTIGGIVYYIIYQIIISLGFDTDLLKMLSALVVALLLSIPYLMKKYKKPTLKHLLSQNNETDTAEEESCSK